MTLPAHWLTPDWPAPPGVHAVCTTRQGGHSAGVYASLNLGDHVGDEPATVEANRQVVRDALDAQPVFMQQVHGVHVARLDASTPEGVQADACVTQEAGIACTIMVADCMPVLLAHRSGRAVAAAHAGWRGLAGGVIESALHALADEVGATRDAVAADTLVWLGPCIGPTAFEVGDDVKMAFQLQDPGAQACFAGYPGRPGKWLADLPALARRRLAAMGVREVYGNDSSAAWCTVTDASRFFSHRRDRVSGRFAAFVWRR